MGKQWKQWQILFPWAPKLTVDSDWSHEIKRLLLLGRTAMTNLDSILKNRDSTLLTKVHSQSYFSSSHVWMWEPDYKEGWALKNWCFWTVVLEKTPESLLDARRSNQSILKKINPEYSLKDWCWSWSSTTLTTWYEGLIHWKRPWCWERLKAGGKGDNRRWDV